MCKQFVKCQTQKAFLWCLLWLSCRDDIAQGCTLQPKQLFDSLLGHLSVCGLKHLIIFFYGCTFPTLVSWKHVLLRAPWSNNTYVSTKPTPAGLGSSPSHQTSQRSTNAHMSVLFKHWLWARRRSGSRLRDEWSGGSEERGMSGGSSQRSLTNALWGSSHEEGQLSRNQLKHFSLLQNDRYSNRAHCLLFLNGKLSWQVSVREKSLRQVKTSWPAAPTSRKNLRFYKKDERISCCHEMTVNSLLLWWFLQQLTIFTELALNQKCSSRSFSSLKLKKNIVLINC